MNDSTIINSPIGFLKLTITGDKLCHVNFVKNPRKIISGQPDAPLIKKIKQQLEKYFNNPEFQFDLPLQISGTVFQLRVWQAMRDIPPGKTLTYGALARQLNTSARAVGNACRANPLPIIIPCHRIVAMQGLGGFNGAIKGRFLSIKRWLLQHEQPSAADKIRTSSKAHVSASFSLL